uniref:Uncharacterized protein n=1 Tax=Arundo donax TaxID=35708 RepID=A0A0A9FKI0_ARUDO
MKLLLSLQLPNHQMGL